jgi:hypothetical protein
VTPQANIKKKTTAGVSQAASRPACDCDGAGEDGTGSAGDEVGGGASGGRGREPRMVVPAALVAADATGAVWEPRAAVFAAAVVAAEMRRSGATPACWDELGTTAAAVTFVAAAAAVAVVVAAGSEGVGAPKGATERTRARARRTGGSIFFEEEREGGGNA